MKHQQNIVSTNVAIVFDEVNLDQEYHFELV